MLDAKVFLLLALVLVALTVSVEAASLRQNVLETLNELSSLSSSAGGRRRRRRSKFSSVPPICQEIYNMEMATTFSDCINSAEVKGQNGVDCSAADMQNYDACASNLACVWWHLNDQVPNQCMPNPCYRINNGLCTIQNTGGRCVWYTQEQNEQINGVKSPGCYKSPCSNPLDNTPSGCEGKSNDFYECVWCPKYEGQAYGCMNAKAESSAQCWNINGVGSTPGCNSCMQEEFGTCESEKCKKNCCQSPLCTCDLSGSSKPGGSANTAINIIIPDDSTTQDPADDHQLAARDPIPKNWTLISTGGIIVHTFRFCQGVHSYILVWGWDPFGLITRDVCVHRARTSAGVQVSSRLAGRFRSGWASPCRTADPELAGLAARAVLCLRPASGQAALLAIGGDRLATADATGPRRAAMLVQQDLVVTSARATKSREDTVDASRRMQRGATWPQPGQSGFDSVAETMQTAFAAYSIKLALPRTPKYEVRKQKVVRLQRSLARKQTVKTRAPRKGLNQAIAKRPSSAKAAVIVKNDGTVAWRRCEISNSALKANAPSTSATQQQVVLETKKRAIRVAPLEAKAVSSTSPLPFAACTKTTTNARRRRVETIAAESFGEKSKHETQQEKYTRLPSYLGAQSQSTRANESKRLPESLVRPNKQRQHLEQGNGRQLTPQQRQREQQREQQQQKQQKQQCELEQKQQKQQKQSRESEKATPAKQEEIEQTSADQEAQRRRIHAQIQRARARVQEEKMRIAEAERATRVEAERVRAAARDCIKERIRAKDHARRLVYAKNKLIRSFLEAQNPVTAVPVAP